MHALSSEVSEGSKKLDDIGTSHVLIYMHQDREQKYRVKSFQTQKASHLSTLLSTCVPVFDAVVPHRHDRTRHAPCPSRIHGVSRRRLPTCSLQALGRRPT